MAAGLCSVTLVESKGKRVEFCVLNMGDAHPHCNITGETLGRYSYTALIST